MRSGRGARPGPSWCVQAVAAGVCGVLRGVFGCSVCGWLVKWLRRGTLVDVFCCSDVERSSV